MEHFIVLHYDVERVDRKSTYAEKNIGIALFR